MCRCAQCRQQAAWESISCVAMPHARRHRPPGSRATRSHHPLHRSSGASVVADDSSVTIVGTQTRTRTHTHTRARACWHFYMRTLFFASASGGYNFYVRAWASRKKEQARLERKEREKKKFAARTEVRMCRSGHAQCRPKLRLS